MPLDFSHLATVGHAPEGDVSIAADRRELPTVRCEDGRVHGTVMFQPVLCRPGAPRPEQGRVIAGGGGHPCAIGGEIDQVDIVFVTFQHQGFRGRKVAGLPDAEKCRESQRDCGSRVHGPSAASSARVPITRMRT